MAILASKNLPGVLEIALLQHLPLDKGVRYAITTLSQYLIVGIGLIVTFNYIGMVQYSMVGSSIGGGKVIDDPAPFVSFEAFLDSSLLLKARCYLASLDDRLLTIIEVNKLVIKNLVKQALKLLFHNVM